LLLFADDEIGEARSSAIDGYDIQKRFVDRQPSHRPVYYLASSHTNKQTEIHISSHYYYLLQANFQKSCYVRVIDVSAVSQWSS